MGADADDRKGVTMVFHLLDQKLDEKNGYITTTSAMQLPSGCLFRVQTILTNDFASGVAESLEFVKGITLTFDKNDNVKGIKGRMS